MTNIDELREKAQNGNVEAMFLLGAHYAEYKLGEPDNSEAAYLWEKAANSGSGEAAFRLGSLHAEGKLGRPKYRDARTWWLKAWENLKEDQQRKALLGEVLFRLGSLYAEGRLGIPNYEDAKEYWEKAVKGLEEKDEGKELYSEVLFRLGALYAEGRLGDPDYETACEKWEEAEKCLEGNDRKKSLYGEVLFRIGDLYAEEKWARKDLAEARKWWEKAADAGYVEAMMVLAYRWFEGDFGEEDKINNGDIYIIRLMKEEDAVALHYAGCRLLRENQHEAALTMLSRAARSRRYSYMLPIILALENNSKPMVVEKELGYAFKLARLVELFDDEKELPPSLSYYCSLGTIRSILNIDKDANEPVFWMTNLISVNDPLEGKSLLKYSEKVDGKSPPNDSGEKEPSICEFFEKSGDDWELECEDMVYCLFLSEASDRLDLWRAYGCDGKGVCITIPMEAFDERDQYISIPGQEEMMVSSPSEQVYPAQHGLQSEGERLEPFRVHYTDDDKKEICDKFNEGLKQYSNIYEQLEKSGSKDVLDAIKKSIRLFLLPVLFSSKDKQYKSEGEYRVMCIKQPGNTSVSIQESDRRRLYVKTRPFINTAITSNATNDSKEVKYKITIGPKVENAPAVKAEIRHRLARLGYLEHFKVEDSTIRYR